MFRTLLRLQALAFWRAPFRSGRLVLASLRALGVAYAVLTAAALGFLIPDTLSVWAPELSARVAVERALVPALVMLTMGRVLFQDVPTRGIEAFLMLPVSRPQVARAVMVRSAVTVFNAAPFAFVVPFALRTVCSTDGSEAALVFVLGMAACIAVSHGAVVVWKTRLGVAPRETVTVVGGTLCAMAAAQLGLGGILGPHALVSSAMLCAVAVFINGYAYRTLQDALYLDLPTKAKRSKEAAPLRGFERPGVRAFLDLEWRLVRRTRYPRGILLNAVAMTAGLAGAVLVADAPTAPMLLFATATVAISAGQFALPFASKHYDRLLTLPGALSAFVRAKLALGVGSVVVLGVLLAVPMLAVDSGALGPLACAVLFGAGVFAPVAVVGSTLAPKPIDVDDQFMNSPRVHALLPQVVLAIASGMGVAPYVLMGPEVGLAAMGGLGAIGVLVLPLWQRGIVARVTRQRYAVANRFRSVL
ncbi:MAG: DUF5687 family protein [Bacteroidota bacterium]